MRSCFSRKGVFSLAKTPEERLESRTIRDLRKEVVKLRRQVAEMRKRNSRIENDFASFRDEIAFESLEDEQAPEIERKKLPCPKCSSDETSTFLLCKNEYYKCLSCGSKGRIT